MAGKSYSVFLKKAMYLRIDTAHHIGKIFVFIRKQNGLVDDLLQLGVLQVVADHHFENLKQLAIRNVSIIVHVIDPESN